MVNKGGAPEGNQNGRKGKVWADAIRRAVVDKDQKTLNKLAKKLVEKGAEGDLASLKEIGDRLDGKPVQAIEGTGDDGELALTMTVEYVKSEAASKT